MPRAGPGILDDLTDSNDNDTDNDGYDDEGPTVEDVRPFVPAKDFAESEAFYEAIGWSTAWTDGEGLALMELGDHRFMLQDYYVREWAENSMLAIVVSDAAAWFRRVSTALADGRFGNARVAEPKAEPWGATVTYVWDPCGVLLHFTEWTTP